MTVKMAGAPSAAAPYDTDVAIVGGGPVGTFLAIMLGKRGKKVTLIERWTEAYGRPRAVTYDHEIARILALLGIDSENDSAINYHDELYYWKDANRENLQIVDWQSTSASGWRVRYWFNQPELELRLTGIADKCPTVTQIRGFEASGMEQDANGVTLTIKRNPIEDPASSETQTIRAKFVVGADGANSFVREALGIENEDKGYFFDWLILDMLPKFDYVASRPGEPAQWQLCDPKRPTTIVPGGPGPVPGGPARRRWEYMVLPHEDPAVLQTEAHAWKLLAPWGLTPENAELERSAVYRFQARWAKEWNKGRCAIAGDAAHLMPPFAGEGMCAGLRDAFALSWRLNGILEGKYGVEVLDSYTTERKEHAKHYINFSQDLGKIICISDPEQAAERDAAMKADLAARGNKPVPTDICQLGPGAWVAEAAHAGELSVQGVVESNGLRDRFDQAVGAGWMVLGLEADPAEALGAERLSQLARIEGRTLRLGKKGTHCDAVDAEGTYAKWLGGIGAKYVLLRPDFYVAATAASADELRRGFDTVIATLALPAQAEAAVA
ncbi:bifunctional 3-(3-hydroxy-phenyl)propionate/3-hydroxycinnamic acid hydroxylase [Sinirhodobacter sp. WL0062]|uniref:Bifunctional 3-(3-hydroxy-phenyl)propionate/3-hydroxycinnamic acid hydroxylase n=1 Tax=Rhodobacter flavimaris TaxID=2907145 RepID=A0ABS8YTW8_9RHOB|nr:bifunctional 3-(3-hydroxy-phenyl)propionate/3-hydroxycinnamic acid hydroxylase [Sinirhodobacter sp. WL0062]MCE5973138.1 bifunctional 3-(3-hydroxy-phenyl)propionate/3-hydroxycinnamic acid hydroxylase [Sinirhodobacter sp. WL0062]